jgi:hypothetical protein
MSAAHALLAFELLERLVAGSDRTHDVPPIVFEMLDGGGVWSYRARSAGPAFVPEDTPGAGLRIRSIAAVLLKLALVPGFVLDEHEPFECEGDVSLLARLGEAIVEPRSVVGARGLALGPAVDEEDA